MPPRFIPLSSSVEDVCRIPGVLGVHELHVWELAKDRNVASMHLKLSSDLESSKGEIRRLHMQIREMLHHQGVHSVTLQTEFINEEMESEHCGMPCISYDCLKQSCCPADRMTQKHTDLHRVNDSRGSGEIALDLAGGYRDQEPRYLANTSF